MTEQRWKVHPEPVWRDRADVIVGVALPDQGLWEQLWGRRVADMQVEVCCVPLYASNIQLGDVVEVDADFAVTRVVVRSAHYGFKVMLASTRRVKLHEVVRALADAGATYEPYSDRYFAVDFEGEAAVEAGVKVLRGYEQAGELWFESLEQPGKGFSFALEPE